MLGILFILLVLVLLALPFLPINWPFSLVWFNYPEKKRPRNLIYIASTLLVVLLTIILMPSILRLADWFRQLRFIVWLRSLAPNHALYSEDIFRAVFANVFFCALVLLVHWITGTLFGLFPKFSLAALKDALKSAKEKWAEKRAAKKKKEQPQEDPQETPQEQPETPEELPPELFPAPEEKGFESRVLLHNGQTKVVKKKKQPAKKAPEKEEDPEQQPSLTAWLEHIFSFFYVREEDGWYVQPQCKKVAKHLRNFVILIGLAYLVIFTLLMIPIFFRVEQYANQFYQLMRKVVENCYLYPAVSLVLLTEIFWFMNGRLPEEKVDELEEVAERRQNGRVVDLDALEQQLVETVGAAYEIKSFYSGDVEGQDKARLPVDTSGDTVLQSVLAFVESQKLVRNDDYLRGVQALQRGEDTLFDAPLFTPVSMYLYPYLNIRISQGERLLVICQDPKAIPGIIENMTEGFRLVQRTHRCLWRIDDRQHIGLNNETDVLVLTPQDFMDNQLFLEAEDFFQRVTIAMLPDADQVVMANNYLCVIIAERLKQATQQKQESRFIRESKKNVQYLFLSTRHTLNLAPSLTEYFMLEKDVITVQAEYAYGNVRLYVWRNKDKARRLLDNIAQQVKLESTIAEIAAKHHVPNISIFTDVAIFPNQIDPVWLDTCDVFDRPIGFTIVSDDSYNLPGTIYAYSRFIGKQASVLHVISKPYMLRDYFYDNAIRSLFERPLMERGMVEHAQLRHTSAVLLLCRLMKGVPVPEFAEKMAQITDAHVSEKITYSELRKLVDACLTMAFGREATADEYGFRLMDRMDNNFSTVPYIQIQESGILDHLMKDTQLTRVRIRGNSEVKVLPLFRRMLAQRHLPDQHMIIDNNNYQINSIDFQEGIIYASPAKAVHNIPDQYIQVREYTLSDCDTFLSCCRGFAEKGHFDAPANISGTRRGYSGGNSEVTGFTLVRGTGALAIDSHTTAYFDQHDGNGQINLATGTVSYVNTDLHRTVENAMYLRLEGTFAGSDQLTMTLAILLQEMMKTMFPDQFFCISVCPILRKPESIYEHRDPLCRSIAGLYPRLHGWKDPVANAIELLIIDDCQGGTGVLDTLFQTEVVYFSNILDMLCEYLDWLKEHPEGAYLNYGAAKTPQLYQFARVREILDVFYQQNQREHDVLGDVDSKAGRCKFCEKMLADENSYHWKNKYNICEECDEELVPDEDQAKLILQHILRFLDSRFGEKLENVSVAFDEKMDISGLDVGAGMILLEPGLPLTAVHCQLLTQAVRLWQLNTLNISGEPEFDGQLLYVLLQYLESLEQHQHRKRLHSRALLGKDDQSIGYCSLRQALQVEKHDNSFRYMREHFTGNGKAPTPPPTRKRSTREDPQRLEPYYRSELTGDEKMFYDLLLQGLLDRVEKIDVSAANLPLSELERLWGCVWNEHPEIHWANRYVYYHTVNQTSGTVVAVSPVYWIDQQEQDKRQAEIDNIVPEYLEGVTEETGDYEAALQIYMNMARRMDYDSLELDRQKLREKTGKQAIEDVDDLRNIYGALVLKRPVCVGYATAYSYLLQKVGIQSVIARGECHGGGRHAWNIVKLEGDHYHVDVTWGDGSNTDAAKNVDEPNFGYFCLTDQDMSLTRVMDPEPVPPACTATACNYFVRNGLFFTAYNHAAVIEKLKQLLQEPARRRVDLRFSNRHVLDAAYSQLVFNGGLEELLRATGRSGIDHNMINPDLNILSFFFQPLEQPDGLKKPEESF